MLEFKISISDIDYGAVADLLLSIVKEKGEPSENKAVKLLLGMVNAAGELPRKAVNALPQNIKDEMVVALVNNNKDMIIDFLQNKAAAKNIAVTVNDIAARYV